MKGYFKRISIFLNDEEKKSWWLILKEVLQLAWLKKQFPLYYFGRFFYKKGAPLPVDYMNLDEYRSIIYSPKLERKATSSLLSNKLSFALFCQANELPSAGLLGYNMHNSFTFGESFSFLKDQKDDLVIEVAVESQSEYIITFNTSDFSGCDKFGVKIVTPYEFMKVRGLLSGVL